MENNSVAKGRSRLSIFFCAALWPGKKILFSCLALAALMAGQDSSVSAETRLTLAEAVSLAEEYDFGIKAAYHESQAAEMIYNGARADRYPLLSLTARSYYIDDLQTIDFPTGKKEIGSNDNYQADFNLTMPLYAGGRIAHRIGINLENHRMKQAALEAERMTAAYRCRKAYLNLMISGSLEAAAISSRARLTLINHDVRNLFDNGAADSIDLLEAELALEKGNQWLDQSQNNRVNASATLSRLIGLEEGEVVIPTEAMPPPDDRPISSSPAPEIDRWELKQLDHVIKAADQAAALGKAAYLPNVNGFAGYSYGMPNKDWFNKTWNDYFMVGLALNWELNLGGKASKQIQAARLKSASARMAQKRLQNELQTGKDVAYNNLEHAYRNFQISKKEYDIARRRYDLARLRQQEGQISINRLLEMEADLAATEQQHQAAIIQYYLAETEYLYAIGSSRIFGGL